MPLIESLSVRANYKRYLPFIVLLTLILPSDAQARKLDLLKDLLEDSSTLRELDAQVSIKFRETLNDPDTDHVLLTFAQQNWILKRENRCHKVGSGMPQGSERTVTEDCLANGYRARLAELTKPPRMNTETRHLCEYLSHFLKLGDGNFLTNRLTDRSKEIGLEKATMTPMHDAENSLSDGVLERLGKSNLWVIEQEEGSAHCQSFDFSVSANAEDRKDIDGPPIFYQWPGDLCGGSRGWAGTLKGHPVFLREDHVDFGEMNHHGAITDFSEFFLGRPQNKETARETRLTLTSWSNGHWAGGCQIVASLTDKPAAQIQDDGGKIKRVDLR